MDALIHAETNYKNKSLKFLKSSSAKITKMTPRVSQSYLYGKIDKYALDRMHDACYHLNNVGRTIYPPNVKPRLFFLKTNNSKLKN